MVSGNLYRSKGVLTHFPCSPYEEQAIVHGITLLWDECVLFLGQIEFHTNPSLIILRHTCQIIFVL